MHILSNISFYLFIFFAFSTLGLKAQKNYDRDELLLRLEEARKSKFPDALASAYFELGHFEADMNINRDQALKYFSRAREYYEVTNDSIKVIECDYYLAKQFFENGMVEEAHDRLLKLEENINSSTSLNYRVKIQLLKFDYFFEKLEIDSASYYLANAESMMDHYQDPPNELIALQKRILLSEILKDEASALEYCETCIELAQQVVSTSAYEECLLAKGRLLVASNDYLNAIDNLKLALGRLKANSLSKKKLATFNLLAQCYQALGIYDKAYDYTNQYSELQDSILNKERIIAINNLSYKYEAREKETEIKLLEMDKAFVQQNNQQQKRALIILGLALGGLLIGIYYIIRFYTDRIKTAKIIEQQNEQINQQKIKELQDDLQINSMESMITGQEVERERIAKDLHDSLGGLLSTIRLQVDHIKDKNKAKNVDITELQHTRKLLDVAVSEVRTISQDLQPGALKRLGLASAINDLVNRYQSSSGPEITFQYYGLPKVLDQNLALGIYRIVQEILNNAIKHAQASEIFIQLNKEGEDLVILIEDDGVGFNPDQQFKSMGIANIKSRVTYLKGSLEIDSRKGAGTSFIIYIPMHFESQE